MLLYETLPYPQYVAAWLNNGAYYGKGRQHSAHIDAPIAEIQRLRLTLDLEGDKFRCFNHRSRDELDSAVQLPKVLSRVMDGMLYIAQLAIFL